MTDHEHNTRGIGFIIRMIVSIIGVVVIVLGVCTAIPIFFLPPAQSVPIGTIESAQAQVTDCKQDFNTGKTFHVGQINYSFTFNDHPFTGTDDTGVPCDFPSNTVGSQVPVYFLDSDPTRSSLKQKKFYAIPSPPFSNVVAVAWVGGFLLLVLANFKFIRNAIQPSRS